jgi:hypothetical protein
MTRTEALIREILTLPVAERVRVVDAVVRDLAEKATGFARPNVQRPKRSAIGWLADEPELADAILWSGTKGRRARST